MSYDDFWRIADTFRDPNVWRIEQDKKWYKHTLWGTYEPFGDVHLNKNQIDNFIAKQYQIKKKN